MGPSGWRQKAIKTSRAMRDVCTPRGSHRPTGRLERFEMGGHAADMQKCADCGVWVTPEKEQEA